MIVSQVLQSKENRGNPQQRIVLMMSCLDLMVSGVWLFTDLLVPDWSEDYYYHLGNQATCSFQGFIVQLSIGGVLTNASLSIYYFLVIVWGWKTRDILKVEPYLLALPLVWGLGTAIAGLVLDLYNPASWDCWIAAYPANCTQSHELKNTDEQTDCERGDNADIYQWAFFFGPLWASIGLVMICMFIVVSKVRQVERRTSVWIAESQRKMAHTKKIAVQSYFYVGAFLITWFWPTAARIVQLCNLEIGIPAWMVTLAGCFIPIQGFFNAVVYFRPRFINCSVDHSDKSKCWVMSRIMWVSLCCCFNANRYNHIDGNDIEGIREGNPGKYQISSTDRSNNVEETTMNGVSKQMDTSSILYTNDQSIKCDKPLSVIESEAEISSSKSDKRLSRFESQATLGSEAGIPSSRSGNQVSISESEPTIITYEKKTNQEKGCIGMDGRCETIEE